jgi:hypothetical protein
MVSQLNKEFEQVNGSEFSVNIQEIESKKNITNK